MLKFSTVVAAIAVLGVSGAQAAGQIGSGALTQPLTWTGASTMTGAGSFNDDWFFLTAEPLSASSSASFSFTTVPAGFFGSGIPAANFVSGWITGFTVTLDGNPLTLSSSSTSGSGITTTTDTFTVTPFTIAAGTHHLIVTGSTDSTGGGYTANLFLAPAAVPEPETYAMMLAGLGALGFLAFRRNGR